MMSNKSFFISTFLYTFCYLSWTQHDEAKKDKTEVSNSSNCFKKPESAQNTQTIQILSQNTKQSPNHGSVKYCLLKELDPLQNGDYDGKSKPIPLIRKAKIFPFKNRSAEEFTSRSYSFDKRTSSRESSDGEFELLMQQKHKQKSIFKNEEKSHLICFKDNNKVVTVKNDSKLMRYNTFDIKHCKKAKITKYKSLDNDIECKPKVKYIDRKSNVSISAEDFDSDFSLLKYDTKKIKHDIICDTVDAWAKTKHNKSMFSNLKHSLFKSTQSPEKEVIYKPLVFGGTFPIDCPTSGLNHLDEEHFRNIKKENFEHKDKDSFLNRPPKMRAYGPAKSFDIDMPI